MYEVVAMVKQLGIPTWFMTLSCADLRWPELFQIIARASGKNMTDEEVHALSYDEKCKLLNVNPVITAKHFQYRVETFFIEILLTDVNPTGKIVYYALRIEFQMRGSPISFKGAENGHLFRSTHQLYHTFHGPSYLFCALSLQEAMRTLHTSEERPVASKRFLKVAMQPIEVSSKADDLFPDRREESVSLLTLEVGLDSRPASPTTTGTKAVSTRMGL